MESALRTADTMVLLSKNIIALHCAERIMVFLI